jgi:hypothetical protein
MSLFEFKTIDLKGKKYVQVVERLKYFRDNHKDGKVLTSCIVDSGAVIVTAEIWIAGKKISTGHALKSLKQEFNLEKAETRAIGRALAIAGIGLDCGISSYEEAQEYLGKDKK